MARKSNGNLGFDYGRQIFLDQRRNSLVCFLNHLKPAEIADYNEIHGQYSLIQLLMQDYSKGKKNNSIFVRYNLSPEDIRSIYHCISQIYPLYPKFPFKQKLFKVYNGTFQEFLIQRFPDMKNPWCITVSNGNATEDKRPIADSAISVTQRYTDSLIFSMFDRIYSFIRDWEAYHTYILLKTGEPLTAKALALQNHNVKQNTQGNNQNHLQNDSALPSLAPPIL